MSDKPIVDILNLLQELSWYFGNHGFNGECCGDLLLVDYMALKKISDSANISVQEIGNALYFTKSGATRVIDRLENKGYVRREHSNVDGRVCCVRITDKGANVVAEVTEKYIAYIEDMLEGAGVNEVSNVTAALKLLVDAARKKAISIDC